MVETNFPGIESNGAAAEAAGKKMFNRGWININHKKI